MITVHITDDHRMVAEGLEKSINESGIAKVTGVSHSITESRKALAFGAPDVLLLDFELPGGNGVDFCAEVLKKHPDIKILMLTGHNEYSIVKRVMDNGASGYILKSSISDELIDGIETVMNGKKFFCDEISDIIKKEEKNTIWLSASEKNVLRCVAKGYTNQQTADELFLALNTVTSYRKNIKQKLGPGYVKIAIENKLI